VGGGGRPDGVSVCRRRRGLLAGTACSSAGSRRGAASRVSPGRIPEGPDASLCTNQPSKDLAGVPGRRLHCRIRGGADVARWSHQPHSGRPERVATAERRPDSTRFWNRVLARGPDRISVDTVGARGSGGGRHPTPAGPSHLRALTADWPWHTNDAHRVRRDDLRARSDGRGLQVQLISGDVELPRAPRPDVDMASRVHGICP